MNAKSKRWIVLAFLGGLLLGLAPAWAGFRLYTRHHLADTDPGNIFYLLWKRGLYPAMTVSHAEEAMRRDRHPESAVQGLDLSGLRQRFGAAEPVDAGNAQKCKGQGEAGVALAGHALVRLGGGPWVAILSAGKAVDVVGCEGV